MEIEKFIYKFAIGTGAFAVAIGVMVKFCKFFLVRALEDYDKRLKNNEERTTKMDKALDVLFAGKKEHTEDLKKTRDDLIRIFDKISDLAERISKMEGYNEAKNE